MEFLYNLIDAIRSIFESDITDLHLFFTPAELDVSTP